MLRQLVALSVLAVGSVTTAHADTISGFFSAAGGTDSFTSSSITFTPNTTVVGGTVGGTFATYLTDGNPITFLPGSLPYTPGIHVAPPGIILFSTTQNSETFAFNLTGYNAAYVTDGSAGCSTGSTCLIVTG